MKKNALFFFLTLNFSLILGCPKTPDSCNVNPSSNSFDSPKCTQGDCKNGQSKSDYPNGNKYEGNFKDGKLDGAGILTYSNNSKYEGNFKDNEFDGNGIFTYCDGSKYVGEWKNGKRNGQGTYTSSSDAKMIQTGLWNNDVFKGK